MKLGDVPGRFKELINRAGEKVSRLPVSGFTVGWYGKNHAQNGGFCYGKIVFLEVATNFLGGKRECCFFCSKDFFENNWYLVFLKHS